MRTKDDLRQLQALPLSLKMRMTQDRIRQWVNEFGEDGVYISFSGGKDSTVLLHLVRELYPRVPAVFCDTGLEYPEIREFVKTFDNVEWLKPKMPFRQVINTYGYPLISKEVAQRLYEVSNQAKIRGVGKRETPMWDRAFNPNSNYAKKYPTWSNSRYDFLNDAPFKISHLCCNVMKKAPSKKYEKETGKKPILGIMAEESGLRRLFWVKNGCNAFNTKRQVSNPMAFWTDQDVLQFIKERHIPICSVYGDIVEVDEVAGQMTWQDYCGFDIGSQTLNTTGCKRTGCMFCLFGCTKDGKENFVRMKQTHPKQYEWIMKDWDRGGLGYKKVIDWINEHGNLHIRY